jgi:hypothetical protein
MLDRAHGEALRQQEWRPPAGANIAEDRLPTRTGDRINAEWQASEYRMEQRGFAGPSVGQVEDAWYKLSPSERQGVQETVHGVPFGKDEHPAPEHRFAEAAAADSISPEARDAYRTLLDAGWQNPDALQAITVEDPAKGRPAPSGGGAP